MRLKGLWTIWVDSGYKLDTIGRSAEENILGLQESTIDDKIKESWITFTSGLHVIH